MNEDDERKTIGLEVKTDLRDGWIDVGLLLPFPNRPPMFSEAGASLWKSRMPIRGAVRRLLIGATKVLCTAVAFWIVNLSSYGRVRFGRAGGARLRSRGNGTS